MPSIDSEKNFRLLRERVLAAQESDGNRYSRSLEELAATPEFQEFMLREYPQPKDFESFLYVSQVLQAEGIKIGAEHFRRSEKTRSRYGSIRSTSKS